MLNDSSNYLKYMTAAAVAAFLLLLSVFVFRYSAVHARSSERAGQRVECFTSIQVHSGESMWEISKRYYSSEYKSMNRYIRKIMSLNHMTSEDIHAGAYLIIPYYITENCDRM